MEEAESVGAAVGRSCHEDEAVAGFFVAAALGLAGRGSRGWALRVCRHLCWKR